MKIHNALDAGSLEDLQEMLAGEWPDIEILHDDFSKAKLPIPIVAFNEGILTGGLAFTWCQPQDFQELKLWINALFVKPEFRGSGIAKALIQEACSAAQITSEKELFVFTHLPQLYISLDWQLLTSREDKNEYVLKKDL